MRDFHWTFFLLNSHLKAMKQVGINCFIKCCNLIESPTLVYQPHQHHKNIFQCKHPLFTCCCFSQRSKRKENRLHHLVSGVKRPPVSRPIISFIEPPNHTQMRTLSSLCRTLLWIPYSGGFCQNEGADVLERARHLAPPCTWSSATRAVPRDSFVVQPPFPLKLNLLCRNSKHHLR